MWAPQLDSRSTANTRDNPSCYILFLFEQNENGKTAFVGVTAAGYCIFIRPIDLRKEQYTSSKTDSQTTGGTPVSNMEAAQARILFT